MTLLVQITDTHIQPPGERLYGRVDTGAHLRETVREINRIRPVPDLLIVTGDLVDKADEASYDHFKALVEPLEMPVYVLPGNHDEPAMMAKAFADTPYFPVADDTFQYAVAGHDFRLLALNSHTAGSELPELDDGQLDWLRRELAHSDSPTMIAVHHPPMKTGIEFIDMGGTGWFQGLKEVLEGRHSIHLVICGHCHTDLVGHIASVPIYMAGSVAHQLVGARGIDVAPASEPRAVAPVLHHFIDGQFVSGSCPWPPHVDENRIDRTSGIPWRELKLQMSGSKAP